MNQNQNGATTGDTSTPSTQVGTAKLWHDGLIMRLLVVSQDFKVLAESHASAVDPLSERFKGIVESLVSNQPQEFYSGIQSLYEATAWVSSTITETHSRKVLNECQNTLKDIIEKSTCVI